PLQRAADGTSRQRPNAPVMGFWVFAMARGRNQVDEALLQALACGSTVDNAAIRAGVAARTVYRRLQDADFQRRLRELRADTVRRTAAMLTAAGGESVKTLLALHDPATPPAVRLGAARTTIELGLKLREAAELAERVAAIEAQLAEATSPHRRCPSKQSQE